MKDQTLHIVEHFSGLCCIKGCDLPVLAMGMCNKHWRRNRAHGSPVALGRKAADFRGMQPIERFNEMVVVDKATGCWEWQGAKDKDGYGSFRGHTDDGVLYNRAHRFSIAYFKKEHPSTGENVCHACDNPSCCNPEHLFIGTPKQNQQDKMEKGRGVFHRGEKRPNAKITEDIVISIRADTRLQKEIAEQYGLTQTTISDIKRRRSWAHVGCAIHADG